MSYCINPSCSTPAKNSKNASNCIACGASLQLKNRYRAQKLLGQGGFGKTFKAIDEDRPGQPLCVIKQFAYSSDNPKYQQMALKLFYEEAKHLQLLGDHPQIPELLAYFDVDGQPYLVQQYIDGQDLEQELVTEGVFSQQKIRELLGSLLPVLDFLHNQSRPVIHRDMMSIYSARDFQRTPTRTIDCLLKQSGNTLVEPKPLRHSVLVKPSVPSWQTTMAILPMAQVFRANIAVNLLLLVICRPIALAYMTCMATYGNGVPIVGMITIAVLRSMGVLGRVAIAGCCGVALGS
jgi:Protein kinase domain